MPQIVKAEILDACFRHGGTPSLIADLPANRTTIDGETVAGMLSTLLLQDGRRVTVQRDASRRAILRLIQPGGLPVQIDALPFQFGYLTSPATRCQCKSHQRRKVPADFKEPPAGYRDALAHVPVRLSRVDEIDAGRSPVVIEGGRPVSRRVVERRDRRQDFRRIGETA